MPIEGSAGRLKVLRAQLSSSEASPPFKKVLIANRGEIAVRIADAAASLGIDSVAIFTLEDELSLHTRVTTERVRLETPTNGTPVDAYNDVEAVVAAAKAAGADCVHPGYGFLSESAAFAQRCQDEDITFIGPPASAIALFGDKVRARGLAQSAGVPVVPGSPAALPSGEAAKAFVGDPANRIGYPVMLKASGGGGGRGMRVVESEDTIVEAFEACRREALAAFGTSAVFVEQLVADPRHIEVQVLGDTHGTVLHLRERDCSVQVRHQKVIEVAPAPNLDPSVRSAMLRDAVTLVKAAGYTNAGTVEFLLPSTDSDARQQMGVDSPADAGTQPLHQQPYYFIECNPRIQVEHTVTEMVTGVDLVEAQFLLAAGRTLAQLGLPSQSAVAVRGSAVQARVSARGAGTLTGYTEPNGPGLRVDSCAYLGYPVSPAFDPLLAKVICWSPTSFAAAAGKVSRALGRFHIAGIRTSVPNLIGILSHQTFLAGGARTSFLAANPSLWAAELGGAGAAIDPALTLLAQGVDSLRGSSGESGQGGGPDSGAVSAKAEPTPPGHQWVVSPLAGQVVEAGLGVDDLVTADHPAAVVLSMKMETVVRTQVSGRVVAVRASPGAYISVGDPLVLVEITDATEATAAPIEAHADPDRIRPDLEEALELSRLALDEARIAHDPKFGPRLARRHERGLRSARENIDALVDSGSFVEFGRLRVAAQRRLSLEDRRRVTPADGIVTGLATVNSALFPDDPERTRCGVLSYDPTVLAGTQGMHGHAKTDRLLELCERMSLPIVWFAEGGGGRPGDDFDGMVTVGVLGVPTFATFARLSGKVPLVGLTSGYCFAGNAAILGCCDVVIATAGGNIGMGGPAMVEYGGLGVYPPKAIGPVAEQAQAGVVDILVPDEASAVAAAKRYLSYFQGPLLPASAHIDRCGDQRALRNCVPENRLRTYDISAVVELIADTGSALPLRPEYGIGIETTLVRVGGRPVGVVANNPRHLGGAIDADGALKAARFVELCDAYDIPLLNLIDTPGFMVGPEAEREGGARKFGRLFVTYASTTVPHFNVVVRKAYGLGAQAMGGGRLMGGDGFSVAWPTGEFGGMGLEGMVRLGFPQELANAKAEGGAEAEAALFEKLVQREYERGKAVRSMVNGSADDVIDPADTRRWLLAGLESAPPTPHFRSRTAKKRPLVSSW